MDEYESLSHTKWECKYHVVFIPKCRRKTLYGESRKHLGEVFRKLATQKESKIEEGHLMPDHGSAAGRRRNSSAPYRRVPVG
jgi:putative transposase